MEPKSAGECLKSGAEHREAKERERAGLERVSVHARVMAGQKGSDLTRPMRK